MTQPAPPPAQLEHGPVEVAPGLWCTFYRRAKHGLACRWSPRAPTALDVEQARRFHDAAAEAHRVLGLAA